MNSHRELPPLYPGQHVTVLNKERGTWHPATVVEKCNEPRSYSGQTPNGNKIRRCRSHLRELFNPQMQTNIKKVHFAEPQPQDEAHKVTVTNQRKTLHHHVKHTWTQRNRRVHSSTNL